jgi:hypothetical protein
LETLERMRDFNINVIPNKTLEKYYQSWIEQIKNKKITDEKFKEWVNHQINYYIEKDKEYTKYLEKLIIK